MSFEESKKIYNANLKKIYTEGYKNIKIVNNKFIDEEIKFIMPADKNDFYRNYFNNAKELLPIENFKKDN